MPTSRPTSDKFGKMIREARRSARLTGQRAIDIICEAGYPAKTRAALNNWEAGRSFPHHRALPIISEVLAIPLDLLVAMYEECGGQGGKYALTPYARHVHLQLPESMSVIDEEMADAMKGIVQAIGPIPWKTMLELLLVRVENQAKAAQSTTITHRQPPMPPKPRNREGLRASLEKP